MPEVKNKPTSQAIEEIKDIGVKDVRSIKGGVYAKSSLLASIPVIGAVTLGDHQGIFWSAFLEYIFPWMLDIAKVYCLIRIAQAFYEEKRGGRDGGTGFQALIAHGKWYLIFWLLPIGVEMIDQLGQKIFEDMQGKKIIG